MNQPLVLDKSTGKFRELSTADLGGNVDTFRDAFEGYDPVGGERWTETKAPGDLVFVDGNAAAASYFVISKDPLQAGTETAIELAPQWHFTMPVEVAFGAHMSQRTLGQEVAIEVVDTSPPLADVLQLEILSIVQTTTTLTVTTVQPHGLSIGQSIGIRGVTDSRVNYPALVVASVPAPNQFTAIAGPGGAIPSLSSYTSTALAATTAALPANTYANGTFGVGATLTANANGAFPDQDGVPITLGARVLVKNEAAAANNGLYVLTQLGDAGTPWILTREAGLDTAAELTVVANALFAVSVYVAQGATQAQREFYLQATVTTVGTTAVTWVDSGTVSPLGFVFFRQRFGRSRNGVSLIYENASATSASMYVRSESGDALPSGTIAANHSLTILSTASAQLVNSPNTYAFGPTSEYRMSVQSDRVQWADSGVDSTFQTNNRLVRTQVCPDPTETYKLRIRDTNNPSLTVPNAQIVSAVKTGTTTANIVTDRPHNYVAGELVVVYGIRAQGATEFPNLGAATPIASIVSPTEFTIVIGTAGTITSYGGYVARVHGGNLMSALGAVAQVVQSATLTTLADGTRQLTLVGFANWASPAATIGDMIELVGCRDIVTGASLGLDGPWKIASVATTNLVLVLPFADQRTLPADHVLTNCGGALIRRTCFRLSFVRVFDFERLRVEALARPSGDLAAAMPVALQGGTVAVASLPALAAGTNNIGNVGGNAAEDAAAGANPVLVGGVVRTARAPTTLVAGDAARTTMTTEGSMTVQPGPAVPSIEVASAARTTSGNSGVISVATGGGLSGLIAVTAIGGTPTLDVTLEESYDNGTTWQQVWAAPRITAVSTVAIPPMLTAGMRRWVWAIGGTGPSLTFAISTNAVPGPCPIVRSLIDRAITPNTLNAASPTLNVDGCAALSLTVVSGAGATTLPVYGIRVSADGANWADTGLSVTVPASSTVYGTITGVPARFAQAFIRVAGVAATHTYAELRGIG